MRHLCLTVIVLGFAVSPAASLAQRKSTSGADVKLPRPAESRGTSKTSKLKGRRVMVTKHGAEIETREGGVVWRAYLGEILSVTLVNNEWLWVFERQGWLNSRDVIPYETAVYEMNARIKESKRAENYGLRGIAHLNHGNYKDAIKDFNEVIRRNPNDAGAYVNRGNAYRLQGENSLAIDDYSKAVSIDHAHFLAMNNRAMVHTTLKKYDLALKDLDAAVLLNKEYPEAHNNRGIVYRERGKYEEAAKEFTQAIRLYPRYADAYVNRAAVYSKLKKYEEARQDLSHAVLLAPNDGDTLNDFAWFLATCADEQFRDGEKAIEMAETAVELTKGRSWNALDTFGAAYAEAGKFAQAERWAEKALEVAPEKEKERVKRHIGLYRKMKPVRD